MRTCYATGRETRVRPIPRESFPSKRRRDSSCPDMKTPLPFLSSSQLIERQVFPRVVPLEIHCPLHHPHPLRHVWTGRARRDGFAGRVQWGTQDTLTHGGELGLSAAPGDWTDVAAAFNFRHKSPPPQCRPIPHSVADSMTRAQGTQNSRAPLSALPEGRLTAIAW